jgi:single-strand DNA-binding protein
MAGSMNKVILVGRLGQDPKLGYTTSGNPVADFSLATDESYTDREGKKVEQTEWHRIKVWNKQAEFCANYLTKGRLVLIEGKLQTRSYEKEGQKHYITEVIAQRVQFMDSRQDGAAAAPRGKGAEPQKGGAQPQGYGDEDLGPAFPSEASGMDDVPF